MKSRGRLKIVIISIVVMLVLSAPVRAAASGVVADTASCDTMALVELDSVIIVALNQVEGAGCYQLAGGPAQVPFLISLCARPDSISADSLQNLYKDNLIRREYSSLHLIDEETGIDRATVIGRLQQAGFALEQIVTQNANWPPDWIEPYSIEDIFQRMIAGRDTLSPVLFISPADSDTFAVEQRRFGGWTADTTATLFFADDTLPVWASGAFTGLLKMKPGWNRYPWWLVGDSSDFDGELSIFRTPPPFDESDRSTWIVPGSIRPRQPLTYYQPDELSISFRGTPGGEGEYKIPWLSGGWQPMNEIVGDDEQPAGWYRGVYRIDDGDRGKRRRILVRLRGPDGKTVRQRADGSLSIIKQHQPRRLMTVDNLNLLRYSPGGEIMTILPDSIILEGVADLGRVQQLRVGKNLTAYANSATLMEVPIGGTAARAQLYSISSQVDSPWVSFSFNLTERVPYKLVQSADPQRISVIFYNTVFQNEWTVYPDSCTLVDWVDWSADENGLRFDIYLNTNQQWGYSGEYRGGRFVLDIKMPPPLNPENPFEGLTFILDAGHGGRHSGAVGPSGLTEKDVNLVYAQYLGKLLQERGATVYPTRQVDTTMMLWERMVYAREKEADIFLWLHNNAPGATRDPMAVSGTSTYYTSPQNWPFARAVYPHLVDLGLESFGRVHRTYYITRQTDMIIFLVEGAFMTHPQDELFMLSDENLQKLAGAVLTGIEDHLRRLVELQAN